MTADHQPQAPVPAVFTGVEEDHAPEGVEQDEGHGEEGCGKSARRTRVTTLLLLLLLLLLLAWAKGWAQLQPVPPQHPGHEPAAPPDVMK